MNLIRINDLPLTPWKNKAGVTREIALCTDEKGLIWRMSFADVDRDGPFSLFPGAARILTVVEGAGLRLRHAGGVLEARPAVPLGFDGDLALTCELVSGPVRDFNLIYDRNRARISVNRLDPGDHPPAKGRPLGLLPLGAPCEVSGMGRIRLGSFLLFEQNEALPDISVRESGLALLVTIGCASEV